MYVREISERYRLGKPYLPQIQANAMGKKKITIQLIARYQSEIYFHIQGKPRLRSGWQQIQLADTCYTDGFHNQ